MAKTKLTVATDAGTFTRTTARTYTHIVVARDVRHEVLEQSRREALKYARHELARYRATLASGVDPTDRHGWDREHTATNIADGSYVRWIGELEVRIAELDTDPITADRSTEWAILGWCGRADLALKLATSGAVERFDGAARFRHVRVYDVATGGLVWEVR